MDQEFRNHPWKLGGFKDKTECMRPCFKINKCKINFASWLCKLRI